MQGGIPIHSHPVASGQGCCWLQDSTTAVGSAGSCPPVTTVHCSTAAVATRCPEHPILSLPPSVSLNSQECIPLMFRLSLQILLLLIILAFLNVKYYCSPKLVNPSDVARSPLLEMFRPEPLFMPLCASFAVRRPQCSLGRHYQAKSGTKLARRQIYGQTFG